MGLFSKMKPAPPKCTSCSHYAELRSPDKLNPDKTVTKGRIVRQQCQRGSFDLQDLTICELYVERPYGTKISMAIPLPAPKRRTLFPESFPVTEVNP